jgi:hypothetical protein
MEALRAILGERIVGAVEDGIVLVVGAIVAGVIAWVHRRFRMPAQRAAALEGAMAAERWDAQEVGAGRPKPTGAEKKKHAITVARSRLPALAKPLLPLGAVVESVLPEARRASTPPPER